MVHIQKNAFLVAFFLSSLDCVINGYDFHNVAFTWLISLWNLHPYLRSMPASYKLTETPSESFS